MAAAPTHIAPTGRPLTGRLVLVALLGFFATIIAVNAVMIYLAVATFGGTRTQSAYKAGLLFSGEARAAKAQAERGWTVSETVDRADDGSLSLSIEPRDGAGRALPGLTVTGSFRHPADARLDHPVRLHENRAGLYVGSASLPAGQWDLVLDIAEGGERLFRSENRVMVK